jgi:hypothetical protein
MVTATHAQVTPERIMQIAWGYAAPLILEAAIRHRVFDTLDSGPKDIREVEKATGASARGLAAILDALVGFEFLSKDDEGRFALTAESAAFLVSTKPGFMGGLIRHTSQHLVPRWLHLNDVVATGKPVAAVNQEKTGGEFFHEFVTDIFPMSYPAAQYLAKEMNFGSSGEAVRMLDLAAGSGVWGIAQAQASARVRVTAVDWPEVIPTTKKTVDRFGLADRFDYVEGDLHDAAFGSGYQLATLGHILHSEGEVLGRRLLSKTFDALESGGTIAVAEFLVNRERTAPVTGLIFAVNMLVNTDNGTTWSAEEIGIWLEEAGFSDPRTIPSPGHSPLILATKP